MELVRSEARLVLGRVGVALQAEELRVFAEEALSIDARREQFEPLVLERLQVAHPDLRCGADVGPELRTPPKAQLLS